MSQSKMLELSATISRLPDDAGGLEGRVSVRLVPFGHEVEHYGEKYTFQRGGIEVPPGTVPVTVDHGKGSLERIGKATRIVETADAMFAELQISDTAAGRDVLTLLADGVLTDVSAGLWIDQRGNSPHQLDHVAIVQRGALGEAGSKVLAVHSDEKGSDMENENEGTADGDKLEARIVELETQVDEGRRVMAEMTLAGVKVKEPAAKWDDGREWLMVTHAAGQGDPTAQARLREFQLADDTTSTAAGLVPDFLSQEILTIIDTDRPFVESVPSDPAGSSGMSVSYPRVTQKPDVDVQATQKTEIASQNMVIDTVDFPLDTYAGASDVSLQLVNRSSPDFVTLLVRELAGIYAQRTESAALVELLSATTQTEVLAPGEQDSSAVMAALAAANTQIINGVRRTGDTLWMGVNRWQDFLSLMDQTAPGGRPLINFPESTGTDSLGSASLTVMRGALAGLRLILCPEFVTGDEMVMGWSRSVATLEVSPQELRAIEVSLLGLNVGVWSLFATAIKFPNGLVEFVAPA